MAMAGWSRDVDPQTYDIIGAAMAVHSELGPGFLELAYARALVMEFEGRGIAFEREVDVPLCYRGRPLGVPFRVDFVCFGDVMVELKALPAVGRSERRQLIHYLTSSGFCRRLLINFGAESLQVERAVAPGRLDQLHSDDMIPAATSNVVLATAHEVKNL